MAALVEAAARVLVEDGYAQMTTKRVAHVAGVSIGSLYQYFPSKEALVAAVAERQTERVVSACEAALRPERPASVAVVTRRLIRALLDTLAAEAELQKALLEQVPRSGGLRSLSESELRLEALVRGYLARNGKEVRPRNLDLAVFLVVRAVRAASWAAVVERPELLTEAELVEELTALALRYLSR